MSQVSVTENAAPRPLPHAVRSVDDESSSVISNALSVDLEDYFHTEVAASCIQREDWEYLPSRVEYNTNLLLDLLDHHEAKSTFFVLGWVARKHPGLIREIHARGHEIGCHSDLHQLVYRLTPDEFRADTYAALQAIQQSAGTHVIGYRAPCFSINQSADWAYEILAELGFAYDSSMNPIYHPTYANPDSPRFPYYVAGGHLLEIPIATRRVGGINLPIGGGAYLRLLPQSYAQAGIRSLNDREGEPAVIYLHPWEIDPNQPRMSLGLLSSIRQRGLTDRMSSKLEDLLTAYRFASISDVYRNAIPRWQPWRSQGSLIKLDVEQYEVATL
ncbi:XrtA system polysaccharide deacetylase [Terriglobus roseus]|uniref:XrtA system polysaccharide deacetylase n=1 Tax=Terriglobus roseus TaxID=392734 RepID=UPI00147CEEAD|nr:XrtA system polysaccharide deacetylase [Terriglobus roseus]